MTLVWRLRVGLVAILVLFGTTLAGNAAAVSTSAADPWSPAIE